MSHKFNRDQFFSINTLVSPSESPKYVGYIFGLSMSSEIKSGNTVSFLAFIDPDPEIRKSFVPGLRIEISNPQLPLNVELMTIDIPSIEGAFRVTARVVDPVK